MPPKFAGNTATGKNLIPGRWFRDEKEGFVLAEAHPREAGKYIIKTKTAQKDAIGESWAANPPDQDGVPDNTQLMHLHEPGLLHNIRHRYALEKIYTYTGYILIAVNPYKSLSIYDDETLQSYRGKSIGTLPPHVFAVADRAYRLMKTDQRNQSILISGESGAGKTETSKIVMKFLVKVGGRCQVGGEIEDKILESNPIMEAFGNAKTIRNNNSSRFGKFMEMQFNKELFVSGTHIETYLLEQSRIVNQSPNERNYHIFYQLCSGASQKEKALLHLESAEKYHYLRQGNACVIDGVDDAQEFQAVKKAMTSLGLSVDVQFEVMKILAGILHLGNIEFLSDRNESASISNPKVVEYVSELLGFSATKLTEVLCTRSMKTTKDTFKIPLKKQEAEDQRDVLSKSIYSHLFDWMVMRINQSLASDEDEFAHIGILDIFGFECFQKNSFEQLCINFTNETLQQYFNDCIFIQELDLYAREGIRAPDIDFQSNQDTIDLINKKPTGIFSILDEEMRLPKGKDSSFSERIYANNTKHTKLSKPPIGLKTSEAFVVNHYAGSVCYTVGQFLMKNNDIKHPDHIALVKGSTLSTLCDIYAKEKIDAELASQNFNSVSLAFSRSLDKLMSSLRDTDSHFIRCIKPNGRQKPTLFEGDLVLNQLRCNGMMAALQLMHAGYPTRCPYNDLYQRFLPMLPQELSSLDPTNFCEALLIALDVSRSEFALGLTRLFFRSGQLAFLENLRSSGQTELPKDIVRRVKVWLAKKRLRKAMWSVLAFKILEARLNALRALKFFVRVVHMTRKYILPLVLKSRRIRRDREAAEKIQATFRGFIVFKKYKPILDKKRMERSKRKEEDILKERERIRQLQELERKRKDEDEQRKLQAQRDEAERIEREKKRQQELLEQAVRQKLVVEYDVILEERQREFDAKEAKTQSVIQELTTTMEQKSKEIATYSAKLSELQEKNAYLLKERESASKRIEENRKKIESIEMANREQSTSQREALQSLKTSHENEVSTLKRTMTQTSDKYEQEIARLRAELEKAKEQNTFLQKKVNQLQDDLAEKDRIIRNLKTQQEEESAKSTGLLSKAENELKVSKEQIVLIQRSLADKTKELSEKEIRLSEALKSGQEEISRMNQLLKTKEEKIRQISSLMNENEDASKKKAESQRREMEKLQQTLNRQTEDHFVEIAELESKLQEQKKFNLQLQEELQESKTSKAPRKIETNRSTQPIISSSESQIENKKQFKKIQELEAKVASLEKNLSDAKEDKELIEKHLSGVEKNWREAATGRSQVQGDLVLMEKTRTEDLDSMTDENFKLRQQIEDLQDQKNDEARRRAAAESTVAKLQAELQKIQEEKRAKDTKEAEKKDALSTLTQQITKLKEENSNQAAEIKKLKMGQMQMDVISKQLIQSKLDSYYKQEQAPPVPVRRANTSTADLNARPNLSTQSGQSTGQSFLSSKK